MILNKLNLRDKLFNTKRILKYMHSTNAQTVAISNALLD